MGKPSEFAFTLSKFSKLPAGKVVFKVTNKGVIAHNFKVCKGVFAAKTLRNACVGSSTRSLASGKSQTITVTLKKGEHEFLCSVAGHARNGMKGLLGVAVPVTLAEARGKLPAAAGSTGGAGPAAGGGGVGGGAGGGGGGGAGCATPTATTLQVGMGDFFFTGVPGSIRCGTVTFNATNIAPTEPHNITVIGTPAGPIANPGQSVSHSVTLNPGTFSYQCDVGVHAAEGMAGAITVT